jgi:hypothetical protein
MCGEVKPLEEFAWKDESRGRRQHHCRPCQAAYRRAHYLANRAKYIAKSSKRAARERDWRQRWLSVYLAMWGCADCGETDPVVLEFDHVRGEKRCNIGQKLADMRWKDLLGEIAKCDVVCANCHKRRTARRAGFLRTRL